LIGCGSAEFISCTRISGDGFEKFHELIFSGEPGTLGGLIPKKSGTKKPTMCQCSLPMAGREGGRNAFHCNDGSSGYCHHEQYCYTRKTWPRINIGPGPAGCAFAEQLNCTRIQ